MPIPFRSDLQTFLTEFIDDHRGVRLGKMFGLPAGYVGRRLFACLLEDGILVRLPQEVARREIRRGASPLSQRPGRAMGSWVMFKPRTAVAARRLTPILEIAARNVAERQVEDMTGVRLPRPKRRVR
jgi:hypothetical protein